MEVISASQACSSLDLAQLLCSKCSTFGLLVQIMTEQGLAVWQVSEALEDAKGGVSSQQVGSQPATRSGDWERIMLEQHVAFGQQGEPNVLKEVLVA